MMASMLWLSVGSSAALAQSTCRGPAGPPAHQRTFEARSGTWNVPTTVTDLCSGIHVAVDPTLRQPGEAVPSGLIPGGRIDRPLGPIAPVEAPIYCRRDDYPFLPPNALGGLPCL